MKFKSLPFIAAATMLSLASCSSDEPVNNQEEQRGDSYITLSINLPSQTGSRATDQGNDQFEDGLPSEYAVHNAFLLIFKGNSEESAVLKNKYELENLRPWNSESDENITTKANTIKQIQDIPANDLWALVILNYQGTKEQFESEFKAGETTFTSLYTTKKVSDMYSDTYGIFMCNAPLYGQYDESHTALTTLVKINANQIYTSLADAQKEKNPLEIFVERGVAKVSVTAPTSEQSISLGTKTDDNEATDVNYVATIKDWKLDVTNKSSFYVRNVTGFDTWKAYPNTSGVNRFYSTDFHRVYWCIDPNYTTFADTDFNKYDESDLGSPEKLPAFEYALENTFDVSNQRQNRSTRAIIRATFAPKNGTPETFYTIGQKGLIYNKAGMQALVKAQCIALFTDKKDPTKYTFKDNTSVSVAAGENLSISAGDVLYDNKSIEGEELKSLNDAIGPINTYKDGICYYVARVQHFGDKYTPWKTGDSLYGDEPAASQNYLGRYGIVRNNWYELQITEIKKLGHPVVPETPSTPDDENEYYMNFNVNIHAWAKRVQNVVL